MHASVVSNPPGTHHRPHRPHIHASGASSPLAAMRMHEHDEQGLEDAQVDAPWDPNVGGEGGECAEYAAIGRGDVQLAARIAAGRARYDFDDPEGDTIEASEGEDDGNN